MTKHETRQLIAIVIGTMLSITIGILITHEPEQTKTLETLNTRFTMSSDGCVMVLECKE